MSRRPFIFTLRGRESVVEKFASLVRATEKDVLLLTADNFTKRGHVAEMFAAAAERGVTLRALVRVDAENAPVLAKMASFAQLRAKESVPGRPADVAIAVFDSRQLMIIHFVPDDASRWEGKDVAILAGEGAMVRAVRSILEAQWEEAEPFEHAAARLASGLPRTRTTMYKDLRQVVEAWCQDMGAVKGTHDIVGTRSASMLSPTFLEALGEAASRGVRQRAIFVIDDAEAGARLREALGPHGELRSPPMWSLQRVCLMDGQEVYFGPSPREPDPTRVEELTVRTNDPAAVRVLREYFEQLWAASTPV